MDISDTAETLVRQFDQMVKRDGGSLSLLGADGEVIRVGYKPGVDLSCDEGACVLAHLELQQLMAETLARRAKDVRVVVELVS
jgi:hypothetical protein